MQRSARRKRGEGHEATGAVYVLPYRRVSGREQEREGLSLDAQWTDLEEHITRHGWVLGTDKDGGFVDVMKGRRVDRPDYQALLAIARRLAAEGKDVVVAVKWLDRLGRRLAESVRARDELKALGVRVYSIMEGGFVSDLVANMMATVAQHEVERLGDRVAEAWDEPFENGWHFVGRLPFGYALRPRTDEERAQGAPRKVLVIGQTARPHVVRAFERAAAGEAIQDVAAALAALPEAVRGKRALSHAAVRWMLGSPTYVARPLPEGEATPEDVLAQKKGRWPALVSDDLWLAVQRRAELRRRVSPTNRATNKYLLTGLIRCACGERMTGSTPATGRFAKYGRYTCSGKVKGASAPKARCASTATMAVIDEAVRAKLLPILDLGEADRAVLRAAARHWALLGQPTDGGAKKRRAQEERRRDALVAQRTNATRLRIRGEVSAEAYREAVEAIERDLEAVEDALAELRGREAPPSDLPAWEEASALVGGGRAAFDEATMAVKREKLAQLVERVVPRRVARGEYEVDIDWTPLGHRLRRVAEEVRAA